MLDKQEQIILFFYKRYPKRITLGEICQEMNLETGQVYPTLYKLEKDKFMESKPKALEPGDKIRPRSRTYQLTQTGIILGENIKENGFEKEAL